jgi:hypothetical protein
VGPEKGGNLIAVEQARVEAARPFEAKYGLSERSRNGRERCGSGSWWQAGGRPLAARRISLVFPLGASWDAARLG